MRTRINASASTAAGPDQAPAQGLQNTVEDTVKKFNIGVQGGVSIDPEMITLGAFGNFGPIFSPQVRFRPGLYLSFGEVTTEFGFDLDLLYTLPSTAGQAWRPYVGGGPNFALSHKGFEAPPGEGTSDDGSTDSEDSDSDRFDFSDTDFEAGFNFIVGARRPSGVFFEMKATAWGVANVKLLAGFSF